MCFHIFYVNLFYVLYLYNNLININIIPCTARSSRLVCHESNVSMIHVEKYSIYRNNIDNSTNDDLCDCYCCYKLKKQRFANDSKTRNYRKLYNIEVMIKFINWLIWFMFFSWKYQPNHYNTKIIVLFNISKRL